MDSGLGLLETGKEGQWKLQERVMNWSVFGSGGSEWGFVFRLIVLASEQLDRKRKESWLSNWGVTATLFRWFTASWWCHRYALELKQCCVEVSIACKVSLDEQQYHFALCVENPRHYFYWDKKHLNNNTNKHALYLYYKTIHVYYCTWTLPLSVPFQNNKRSKRLKLGERGTT